jgi:hypothetical protein
MARFMKDDEVSYVGAKFAEDLAGAKGVVYARVGNSENEVVVDFGRDSYIMDEWKHLIPFNPALKAREKKEDRNKHTKAEHRRRTQADDESDS